jgi:hypothetical protein
MRGKALEHTKKTSHTPQFIEYYSHEQMEMGAHALVGCLCLSVGNVDKQQTRRQTRRTRKKRGTGTFLVLAWGLGEIEAPEVSAVSFLLFVYVCLSCGEGKMRLGWGCEIGQFGHLIDGYAYMLLLLFWVVVLVD